MESKENMWSFGGALLRLSDPNDAVKKSLMDDAKIAVLEEMFPDLKIEIIIDALEKNEWNQDQALDFLLTATSLAQDEKLIPKGFLPEQENQDQKQSNLPHISESHKMEDTEEEEESDYEDSDAELDACLSKMFGLSKNALPIGGSYKNAVDVTKEDVNQFIECKMDDLEKKSEDLARQLTYQFELEFKCQKQREEEYDRTLARKVTLSFQIEEESLNKRNELEGERCAKQLQESFLKEFEERNRKIEEEDERLAKELQEAGSEIGRSEHADARFAMAMMMQQDILINRQIEEDEMLAKKLAIDKMGPDTSHDAEFARKLMLEEEEKEAKRKQKEKEDAERNKQRQDMLLQLQARSLHSRIYDESLQHKYVAEDNRNLMGILPYNCYLEPVLRSALENRFMKAWALMKVKHGSNTAESTPVLAFHGTSHRSMERILETGFLIPGKHKGVNQANGAAYGIGVYVSPNPNVASGYATANSDGKMLVLAVLKGKSTHMIHRVSSVHSVPHVPVKKKKHGLLSIFKHKTNSKADIVIGHHTEPKDNLSANIDVELDDLSRSEYNSTVSGDIWVIYESCQVLPLYCVHFDGKNST